MENLLKRILHRLSKILYMPLCRAYARHIIGDRPTDTVMRFLCGIQFLLVHNYWPNFKQPQRFSEKIWYRMLYDRDPILTLISDKLSVRDHVTQKVGSGHLIPLLWHGDNPKQIPFDNLPDKFVIKTNHGCGYNIIVQDKSKLDLSITKQKLKKWLDENFCRDKYLGTEWGYKNVKPFIIVEKFLGNQNKAPVDFKFYCFTGHVEIITLHFDRFEKQKVLAYDGMFKLLKYKSNFKQCDGTFQLPPNCGKMVQLAETLSKDFEFIRVDLYNLDGKIYFGELTPYPGGVSTMNGFYLPRYDEELGKKWTMKK